MPIATLVNGDSSQVGGTNRCDGCSSSYLCIGSFIADSKALVGVRVICKDTGSSKPDGEEDKFEEVCVHNCALL